MLNPLWYAGSLSLGVFAGALGDRWNLGFLAETERQVEAHLDSHLRSLPEGDLRSRAIVDQMRLDEIQHAETAVRHGAAELPSFVKHAMKAMGRVMTGVATASDCSGFFDDFEVVGDFCRLADHDRGRAVFVF